ncbi:MAG: hypothetical protein KA169_08190, partial [Burkholderiaceae bacterium]|nr:hypothetical protein [Burkholderiaceae bacterium]
GPGCSEDELSRIALRGARVDESTSGHGLGLAIAKGVAASYGAQLRLGRSAELGGLEATVIFPPN